MTMKTDSRQSKRTAPQQTAQDSAGGQARHKGECLYKQADPMLRTQGNGLASDTPALVTPTAPVMENLPR